MSTYTIKKKKKANLTRAELIIDLTVLVALLAFGLPTFLRAQIPSNELAALGHVRAITGAQNMFHSEHGRYAESIRELASDDTSFLDANWTASIKSGYTYSLETSGHDYTLNAAPVLHETTGNKYFYTDSTGIVRFEVAGPAGRYSAPVDEVELAQVKESF